MEFDRLSNQVIGCALEVHRTLGPGLLESAYERCLAYELSKSGIPFKAQHALPVHYKDIELDCEYRIDLFVDNQLVVEVKSVERLTGVHRAQLLTYMKLSSAKIGLLMNFNVEVLKKGVQRFVL